MSGSVAHRKRLIRISITPGNLKNSHVYITGHYDFFPDDCIGPTRKNGQSSDHSIQILLEGLDRKIETDIGREAGNGKPRRFLRARAWFRRFFEYHSVRAGDELLMERRGPREYRL